MSIQEIVNTLREAVRSDRPVRITGYRSESGEVSDFVVRIVGKAGYHRLLSESIKELQKRLPSLSGVYLNAALELLGSWGKSVAGQHSERNYNTKESQQILQEGVYLTQDQSGASVTHMEQIERTVLHEVKAGAVNSSEKTLAKQILTKESPAGRYIGRLNLYPGKFEKIELV